MLKCYILDEFGDTESASLLDSTAECVRWYHEQRIDFSQVSAAGDATFIYKRNPVQVFEQCVSCLADVRDYTCKM